MSATEGAPAKSKLQCITANLGTWHKDIISGFFFFSLFFFVFYSCKMDMSSLHNGETRWHFLGCRALNQRDQQYVECQRGDIWFPFHSCGITAGMPADITILPSWRWACQTFHSTSMFSKKITYITANCGVSASSWYKDICDRFDLTKAIRCRWHLASASGDRQVKGASQQIGPVGIVKVGVVWGYSQGMLVLDWTPH